MCIATERVKEYGPSALTDNELLTVIFGAKEGKDYGDIRNLTVPELIANGFSRTEAIKGVSLIEYATRLFTYSPGKKITSPEHVANLCSDLKICDKEKFRVFFLKESGLLISFEDLTIGTESKSLVSVREVISKALRMGAGGIILSHNHPLSTADPSAEDIEVTERVKAACATVGILLKDHVTVSPSGWFSFKENGLVF